MTLLKRKPKEEPMTAESRAAGEKQERKEREQKRDLVAGVHNTRAKIDPDRLTVDECEEMKSLHRKALDVQPDGSLHRTDLAALSDRERRRFQELLDKGLPDPERERQRALRAERDRRVLVAFADEVANEGVPPARRLGLRSGEALIPAEAFTCGVLHVGDLGLLALLAHVWSSGTASVFKGGRWSGDGRALLLPKRPEFAEPDLNRAWTTAATTTHIVDSAATFEHLTKNGYLLARRDAGDWTVRLGPRLAEWDAS